jgi:hypothetical protein
MSTLALPIDASRAARYTPATLAPPTRALLDGILEDGIVSDDELSRGLQYAQAVLDRRDRGQATKLEENDARGFFSGLHMLYLDQRLRGATQEGRSLETVPSDLGFAGTSPFDAGTSDAYLRAMKNERLARVMANMSPAEVEATVERLKGVVNDDFSRKHLAQYLQQSRFHIPLTQRAGQQLAESFWIPRERQAFVAWLAQNERMAPLESNR